MAIAVFFRIVQSILQAPGLEALSLNMAFPALSFLLVVSMSGAFLCCWDRGIFAMEVNRPPGNLTFVSVNYSSSSSACLAASLAASSSAFLVWACSWFILLDSSPLAPGNWRSTLRPAISRSSGMVFSPGILEALEGEKIWLLYKAESPGLLSLTFPSPARLL